MLCKAMEFSEVLARILLATIFILAAVGKLGAPEETMQYMRSFGISPLFYYPTILFESVSGLLLLVGFGTRLVAFGLAVFTILSAVIFHADFADRSQMVMFLKNFAIAGGLLMVARHGAFCLSVDQKLSSTFNAVRSPPQTVASRS